MLLQLDPMLQEGNLGKTSGYCIVFPDQLKEKERATKACGCA